MRVFPLNVAPRVVLALAATLLTVACATEPQLDADGNPIATNLSATGEPLICRNEQVTGTNFRERVCLTNEGWKALQRAERRVATEFSRQASERSGQQAGGQSNAPAGGGI